MEKKRAFDTPKAEIRYLNKMVELLESELGETKRDVRRLSWIDRTGVMVNDLGNSHGDVIKEGERITVIGHGLGLMVKADDGRVLRSIHETDIILDLVDGKWNDDPPLKEGWYWWRKLEGDMELPCLCEEDHDDETGVTKYKWLVWGEQAVMTAGDVHGQFWSVPIIETPDEEDQDEDATEPESD